MKEEDLSYLVEAKREFPQLSHAANILTKINGKLNAKQRDALEALVPEYVNYLKTALSLKIDNKKRVMKLVDCINAYYNFMHFNGLENVFTAQGKFRPTILEEFLYLLFKNYVSSKIQEFQAEDIMDSGAVKAYSNIYFKARDFQNFIENPEI